MIFNDFKTQIWALANDSTSELSTIEAMITSYYKYKPLPFIHAPQTFIVRCSNNKPGCVFKNISRCSYNPKPSYMQRCNYPNQKVLYGSLPTTSQFATASLTSVVETAWEHIADDKIMRLYCTISRWRTKRPLKLWVLPFAQMSTGRNEDFEPIKKNALRSIQNHFIKSPQLIKDIEYISDLFCTKADKDIVYRITSAFYNALLNFDSSYDGLAYPSANTEGARFNVVLNTDLVDNNTLFCDLTMMYSIQRVPNNIKELKCMPASNIVLPGIDGSLDFSGMIV